MLIAYRLVGGAGRTVLDALHWAAFVWSSVRIAIDLAIIDIAGPTAAIAWPQRRPAGEHRLKILRCIREAFRRVRVIVEAKLAHNIQKLSRSHSQTLPLTTRGGLGGEGGLP
ncbi:hypothetical protein, partial [Stenotrophomonas maltophilia]|uniref:hypothetical protein n=1 Tax=Stenotrophomonas maltophilia TaxID=40324 RepID=UPI0039C26442